MTRHGRKSPSADLVLACVLVLLALSVVQATAATQDSRVPLSLDRYLDWEELRQPLLSPDGSRIIYERRWVDAVHDEWDSALWMMHRDGTRNRFLVEGSQPIWSPQGDRIAFVAPGDPSGSQIFVRWMDAEGATSQLTRVSETPTNLSWSPDGKSIGFQMVVPPESDAFAPRSRVITRVSPRFLIVPSSV